MKREDIDLDQFWEILKSESDRGVVLVTAELMNSMLTELFEKYLILNSDLKKSLMGNSMSPLYGFSNKIKMAYSLGLIQKIVYDNLECVRSVRNKFAHRIYDASFENDEIIHICKKVRSIVQPNREYTNYKIMFCDLAYSTFGYLAGRISLIEKQSYNGREIT